MLGNTLPTVRRGGGSITLLFYSENKIKNCSLLKERWRSEKWGVLQSNLLDPNRFESERKVHLTVKHSDEQHFTGFRRTS